jgi:putative phage-type endonuclease
MRHESMGLRMNAPQGTDTWLSERAGCATASRFADVLATIKTGEAASRRGYRMQLVTERLTGNPVTGYTNAAMMWGTEQEPFAREAYEAESGAMVMQTGFIKHSAIPWCGASPDGFIDADGLVEIKCPESTTHLEWMEGGKVPAKHVPQIQGQMWVTGRTWCDFVSYDPRFPPNLQLFIVRINRDEDYIKTLDKEVKEFLVGVDDMVQKLLARK